MQSILRSVAVTSVAAALARGGNIAAAARSFHETDAAPIPGIYTMNVLNSHMHADRVERFVAQLDLLGAEPSGDGAHTKISFLVASDASLAAAFSVPEFHVEFDRRATEDLRRREPSPDAIAAHALSRQLGDGDNTIAGFPCYRNLRGMFDLIDELVDRASAIESLEVASIDIGDTWEKTVDAREGFDMIAMKVTGHGVRDRGGTTDKGLMYVTCGIHAREYATPELCARWVEGLVDGYGRGGDAQTTSLLDHTDIYVVLEANPDGRDVAENHPELYWRKNTHSIPSVGECPARSSSSSGSADDDDASSSGDDDPADCNDDVANGDDDNDEASSSGDDDDGYDDDGDSYDDPDTQGVDLNRNFPFKRGLDNGSSDDPCDETYRGAAPASEPEMQALTSHMRSVFPASQRKRDPEGQLDEAYPEDNLGVYVDVHSYGEVTIYPWNYVNCKSPNDEGLQAAARKVNHFNGHDLAGPRQAAWTYKTSGDSAGFAYGELGACALLYELGNAHYQDCPSFEEKIAPGNIPSLTYLASISSKPFTLAKGPDVMSVRISVDGSLSSQAVAFTVKVSDRDLSSGPDDGFLPTTQVIESVALTLDMHPDDTADNVSPAVLQLPVLPNAGTAEATQSYVVDDIAHLFVGPTAGEHTAYVWAVDSSGYSGPVFATLFTVPESVHLQTPKSSKSTKTPKGTKSSKAGKTVDSKTPKSSKSTKTSKGTKSSKAGK